MDSSVIIAIVIGFLVLITFMRRSMLKEKVERRIHARRTDKRRMRTGRRKNEFHETCETKNRRKDEDRRSGKRDRRHRDRRRG